MAESTPSHLDELESDLVAYLDGELDDVQTRRIEELLARDERARHMLQMLETAWGMLDQLPRAEVDLNFTSTTVEMIALDAEAQLALEQQAGGKGRGRRWAAGTMAFVAAVLLGYLALPWIWGNPDERVLDDYSVLVDLEEMLPVESLPFLEQLAADPYFPDEGRDAR